MSMHPKETKLLLDLNKRKLINNPIRNYHIRALNALIRVLEVYILKNNNQHRRRGKDN